MDLLAAWLLFPLLLCLIFLGWGLLVERLSGRDLPGMLLLPVGLAAVLVAARVLVVAEFLVNLALPLIALIALVGLVLARDRLRALRFDPWAAAAAFGVAFMVAAPVILSGEPTFTGSLVLGDTAHQLALADRLGEAGTQSQPPPDSSYGLTVRKYFDTAYPLGPQATLGLLAPMGLLDVAWLYQPFLALLVASTALALNGLLYPSLRSRRARALVAFIAAQPALVIAFALQGSIKEMAALAGISLTIGLVALMLVERWPARASVLPLVSALATVGALGPAGLVYVGPPVLVGVAARLVGLRGPPLRRALFATGGAVFAAVLLALPVLSGVTTAFKANDKTLSEGNLLGNLPRPLDVLHALGAWPVGDYRYAPLHPKATAALALLVGAVAAFGLIMAIRRRALGPLLLTGTLMPISALLWLRGNPYADAKVLVLASTVAPLLAMLAAVWLLRSSGRGRRLLGAAVAVVVGGAVLVTNVLAYHDAQLAPYDRYREQLAIADKLKGRGPVVFTEFDEFAKHFMRSAQVLSQPEWPFEFPTGPLNPKGAAQRLAANTDGLHPSLKSPLDPDGISPTTLAAARFLVLRRSPTASRPPANYRLRRRLRYYEVWERTPFRSIRRHLPLGEGVFEPGSRPSCRLVKRFAAKAEDEGAQIAYAARRAAVLYNPVEGLGRTEGFGEVEYELYPKSVATGSAGSLSPAIRVPETGRYSVWVLGSFTREVAVSIDGRRVGGVSYESANQGSYLRLGAIELTEGLHRLELTRAGGDLRPGSGGGDRSHLAFLGPVVLSSPDDGRRSVRYLPPRDAERLCGQRVDWLEAVRPAP